MQRWRSAPPMEGSRGLARRAALEEREALRLLLAGEIAPEIPAAGSGRRRTVPGRRPRTPSPRRGPAPAGRRR
jgi:hypothetical protein